MDVILEADKGDPYASVERDLELLTAKAAVESTKEVKEPLLRCWENSQCLVVGKQVSRWQGFDAAKDGMEKRGWPVFIRSTGGTIVPHYSGVLNISYIYPVCDGNKSFTKTYQMLCNPLLEAFNSLGLKADTGPVKGSYCDGDFNIRINQRKIAGTAQQWKRSRANPSINLVLVHASINTSKAEKGVEAVNVFLENCSSDDQIEVDTKAHTDLEKELLTVKKTYNKELLVDHIVRAFNRQIDSLKTLSGS